MPRLLLSFCCPSDARISSPERQQPDDQARRADHLERRREQAVINGIVFRWRTVDGSGASEGTSGPDARHRRSRSRRSGPEGVVRNLVVGSARPDRRRLAHRRHGPIAVGGARRASRSVRRPARSGPRAGSVEDRVVRLGHPPRRTMSRHHGCHWLFAFSKFRASPGRGRRPAALSSGRARA